MTKFLGIKARRTLVFIFDLIAIGLAFTSSFLLRFDFSIPHEHLRTMLRGLPWIYIIQSTVFVSFGLYRGLWSFASLRDLFLILRSVAMAVALSVGALAASAGGLTGWPRSVFVMDTVMLVLILGGGRFAYRMLREGILVAKKDRKRILVIGAGHSANLIAREFSTRSELSSTVIGFLDDNIKLRGVRIQGASVVGQISSLAFWLEKLNPSEVIIAIPSLPGYRVRQIVNATREVEIPCRICPPLRDVLLGRVELSQLREVRVEDLLRRDVVKVDDAGLTEFIKGRRILVTGGGGSIGSELCRQILRYSPAQLVLYERSEYNLYRIEQELSRRDDQGSKIKEAEKLKFVVGDILDERKLLETFEAYLPEIVLHSAAYKHVPMMEDNIYEAVQNNVIGTHRVLKACNASNSVSSFVLVSTDKAVRPTSIMGATKRMAEIVTHAFGEKFGLRTTAVRFGNVLDSEGSVLPLFRSQINQGGPVTITHPEVTRYFMTIPEASLLVLQAALLGRGGEVFLLDMGEPVLIRELAEELIKLSGLQPYQDIEIVYSGLRKGEKLFEELLIDLKNVEKTSHPKIMVSGKELGGFAPAYWESQIDQFTQSINMPSKKEIKNWIKQWVPEYFVPGQSEQPAQTLFKEQVFG